MRRPTRLADVARSNRAIKSLTSGVVIGLFDSLGQSQHVTLWFDRVTSAFDDAMRGRRALECRLPGAPTAPAPRHTGTGTWPNLPSDNTPRLLVLVFALASPEQLTHSAPVLATTLTGRRGERARSPRRDASVLRPHPWIRSKPVEPCHQDDQTASPRSRAENTHSLQVATLSSIRKKFRRPRLSLFIRQHTRGRISTAIFRGNAMAVDGLDSTSLPIR